MDLKKIKKNRGFTLIELLVVILIAGLLVALAYPSYTSYLLKSKRTDGISTILDIQLREERYRTTNTTYGTAAQVYGGGTTSPEGHYTIAISNVGANTYTVTATAVGGQASDAEDGTSCTPLSLAVNNGAETFSPAACW